MVSGSGSRDGLKVSDLRWFARRIAENEWRATSKFNNCLWPEPYRKNSVDSLWDFVRLQTTWDEPAKKAKPFPDCEYLKVYVALWWECREMGRPLITEKCRRMVISWAARACELWALGVERCDQTLIGDDLEAAAKHVWRIQYLYSGLQKSQPSWNLPPSTPLSYRGRLLSSFELPNGSRCQYGNGQSDQQQGEGSSIITMEEFGIYSHAGDMLAQAKIVTQPAAGETSGFINIITNSSFNEAWQRVKKPLRDNPKMLHPIMDGFERADLPTGEVYAKLHYFANPLFDAAWLEERRIAMAATPVTFRLQYLMDDSKVEGALIDRETVERTRVQWKDFDLKSVFKRVLAIDPTVKDHDQIKNQNAESDDCGMIVVSVGLVEGIPHLFFEHDFSGKYSPAVWSKLARNTVRKCEGIPDSYDIVDGQKVVRRGRAGTPINFIVYEENQGGDLVRLVLQTSDVNDGQIDPLEVPIMAVRASIGKRARAEPLGALFEQGRAHIVGHLPEFEHELCTWSATSSTYSPGRIDAAVWGAVALGLGSMLESHQIGEVDRSPRKVTV